MAVMETDEKPTPVGGIALPVVGWIAHPAFEVYCLDDGGSADQVAARYDGSMDVEPLPLSEAANIGLTCIECHRPLVDVWRDRERTERG